MDQLVERLNVSSLNSRDEFGFTSFASNLGRWCLGKSLLTVILQPRVCHLEHFPPRAAFFLNSHIRRRHAREDAGNVCSLAVSVPVCFGLFETASGAPVEDLLQIPTMRQLMISCRECGSSHP